MENTKVKITFEFPERTAGDVEMINQALGGMKFSSVNLAQEDGYLAVTKHYREGEMTGETMRYGFDTLVLECGTNDGEEMHTYQIDMETEGADSNMDAQRERWNAAHPDRAMRQRTCVMFDEAVAYIVLHHEA